MGQTTNYGLKQWENWERPDRQGLNSALAELDETLGTVESQVTANTNLLKTRSTMTCGAYVGNGSAERRINLGIFPRTVLVERQDGLRASAGNGAITGGLAITDHGMHSGEAEGDGGLWIARNGFYALQQGNYALNETGFTYLYWAAG